VTHKHHEGVLQQAVDRAGGNLSAAARALGLTRPQLSYRLQRLRER
jgi:DNA-binding transcriptional LysR family regulator